jgi:hypothetical protein
MITATDRTSRLKAGFIRPGAVVTNDAAAERASQDDASPATPRNTDSPRKRPNFRPSPTSVGDAIKYVFAAAAAAAAAVVAAAAAAAAAADDDDVTRHSHDHFDDHENYAFNDGDSIGCSDEQVRLLPLSLIPPTWRLIRSSNRSTGSSSIIMISSCSSRSSGMWMNCRR